MQRVRLHQHPVELNGLWPLPQGLCLDAGIGGIGGLGDRHNQRLGAQTYLGNEPRGDRVSLRAGTPQGLVAIEDQGLKGCHIQLSQQKQERRVRGRCAEIGAEQNIERLPVAPGETFRAYPASPRC